MTKICYIIGELSRHGAEKQLYELLKGLDRDRFVASVIVLSEGGYWAEAIRRLDVPVFEIPRKKSREYARLFRVIRILRELKPSIVHTYMFSANTYGRVAALLTGVPVVIASERNSAEVGKDKDVWQISFDRLLARFSDAIICNTRYAARALVEKYAFDPQKVFTVHNGIRPYGQSCSEPLFENDLNSCDGLIGTVGRLFPQKDHRLFLDVARLVLQRCPDKTIRFLLIGDGPLRDELILYARSLGIERNVIFAGERTDVPELLRCMDVFVMTSEYEGLSNAIMEAMLAGLPVVATDVGGNRELIENGRTGFLCAERNAEELAGRVIALFNDEKTASKIGSAGKQRILSDFSMTKMVNSTEKIYLSLLKRGRTKSAIPAASVR